MVYLSCSNRSNSRNISSSKTSCLPAATIPRGYQNTLSRGVYGQRRHRHTHTHTHTCGDFRPAILWHLWSGGWKDLQALYLLLGGRSLRNSRGRERETRGKPATGNYNTMAVWRPVLIGLLVTARLAVASSGQCGYARRRLSRAYWEGKCSTVCWGIFKRLSSGLYWWGWRLFVFSRSLGYWLTVNRTFNNLFV